jgi:phosphoribosylformimino-5-aminoimidazole carboxamide ribotide isomerase
MKLIPVIDLMHGSVVTAVRGERDSYAPSNTPLCHSSNASEVIRALLDLYPFETCYIADLDAITGIGSQLDLIQQQHLNHPGLELWVDNGLTDLQRICDFARPVIGSESLVDVTQLSHLSASLSDPVLSLDFIDDRLMGLSESDLHVKYWPQDVIIMSLSRVGSVAGPDTLKLQQLSTHHPEINLYAAGGIRNRQDLEQLRHIGAAGALLSTALHQGQLDREEIGRFLNI